MPTRLSVRELVLPAADLGRENPLPGLRAGAKSPELRGLDTLPADMRAGIEYGRLASTLPCLDYDGYDRQRTPASIPAIVLENDHLAATILPGRGGRVYSLVDKGSGRELIYRNPSWQPANLALRNAWFAGGIEWNLGSRGHSTLTCEPVHAASLTAPDGTPMLRLWEWERTRGLVQQIDLWLPSDSHHLLAGIRIRNPHNVEVPAYWWTNIAVPQTPTTRVLSPARQAWRRGYDGSLDLVDVSDDASYPMRHRRSADFFFELVNPTRPWIAAIDDAGGFVQTSTARLRGRKLFVWGEHRGGRRWQEWLAPDSDGDGYAEIQAGLARTQLEHVPLPAGTSWDWMESFGPLPGSPEMLHTEWREALRHAERAVVQAMPSAVLHHRYDAWRSVADDDPVDVLHRGSGWGALERRRDPRLALPGAPFSDDLLTDRQRPWLDLLANAAPTPDPAVPPDGTLVAPEWWRILDRAADTWWTDYHRGVVQWVAGNQVAAVAAWHRSIAAANSPWAQRNLAIAMTSQGRLDDMATHYLRAVELAPDEPAVVREAVDALIASGRLDAAAHVIEGLTETVRTVPRIALATVRLYLAMGRAEDAEALLDKGIELADLREGADDLADLWRDVQRARGTSRPLPAHYDFAMAYDE